jgi:hypothetical protein
MGARRSRYLWMIWLGRQTQTDTDRSVIFTICGFRPRWVRWLRVMLEGLRMRYRVCVALYAEVMEGKSVTSKIRWRAVSKSE